MTWEQRNPKATLTIYTKDDAKLYFGEVLGEYIHGIGIRRKPINDVISMTTTNSINESAGTFTIELVWRLGETGELYYYERIRPMDIVEISLNGIHTTMMGIINTVKRHQEIIGNKPKRSVLIEGKSLGAIWDFDLVKYFEYTTGIPEEFLERNLNLQLGNIKLKFFGENAIKAITTLYKELPALDIVYFGDKRIKDFIDVGSELFCKAGEKQYNLNLDPYSGTLFDYFRRYVGQPFNEIWTDSKKGKLYLRMRPAPFSIGDDSISTVDQNDKPVSPSKWENIMLWQSDNDFPESYSVPKADIISEDIGRTHTQSYSIFGVLPVDKIYGNVPEYEALPPLIVPDLYKQFGSRDRIIRIPFIPIQQEGGLEDSAFSIFKGYRNKLYLMDKDNHRLESGTLIIKGRPEICVGDVINCEDKEYYPTTVQHAWWFGSPLQSVLTVERGMNSLERKKRYNDGITYLKNAGEAV